MTSISDITATSQQVQTSRNQLNQDFDDFLTLLTTQLQNQDPLEPLDSNDFTNQLVQFSQVEQQLRSNDILDDLRALDVLRITELGLGFVGLDVELSGDTFEFDGSKPLDLGYTLPQNTTKSTVVIKNAEGETIYTYDGETTQGVKRFTWDGKNEDGFTVPAGTYTIEASATDSEGVSLNIQTNVPGRVDGIESAGNGEVLLLIGDLKVPITSVTRAKIPDSVTPPAATTEDPGT